jgi:hypothetical protein
LDFLRIGRQAIGMEMRGSNPVCVIRQVRAAL